MPEGLAEILGDEDDDQRLDGGEGGNGMPEQRTVEELQQELDAVNRRLEELEDRPQNEETELEGIRLNLEIEALNRRIEQRWYEDFDRKIIKLNSMPTDELIAFIVETDKEMLRLHNLRFPPYDPITGQIPALTEAEMNALMRQIMNATSIRDAAYNKLSTGEHILVEIRREEEKEREILAAMATKAPHDYEYQRLGAELGLVKAEIDNYKRRLGVIEKKYAGVERYTEPVQFGDVFLMSQAADEKRERAKLARAARNARAGGLAGYQ